MTKEEERISEMAEEQMLRMCHVFDEPDTELEDWIRREDERMWEDFAATHDLI